MCNICEEFFGAEAYEQYQLRRRLQGWLDVLKGDPGKFLLLMQHARAQAPVSTRGWGGLALLECANFRIPG